MGKKIPVVTVAEPAEAARLADLPLEASVAMADVAGAIKDGLLAVASATGLVVMFKMMEAELAETIGPKHARIPRREGNWHGSTTGSVVLRGRKVRTERPRGRTAEGKEIALDTWAVFSSEDLLTQVVMERMLAGVPTRRHADVAEPIGDELDARFKATSRSAVSRRFRRATEKALGELLARDLHDLDVAVVMIDGIEVAGSCLVAALLITTDGKKIPVGLYLGDTENKTVVTDLLVDLVARGLDAEGGMLVVIDGAKALAAGCARCSARKPSCSVAPCTSGATWPPPYRRRRLGGSTVASLRPSPTPTRTKAWPGPGPSPPSWRRITPTRRPPSGRACRTCSPSAAWGSLGVWPRP